MGRKINYLGLAAGIVTLVMLAVSFYLPWWQITIGQSLIKINASPVNTTFGVFGTQLTIPLIWALNLITILTFAASGVIMLIYSLVPTKTYAKHLIGFSWKKPLYTIIGFVGSLVVILLLAGHFGLYLPLNGSQTVTLPSNWTQGATVTAVVTDTFEASFWLAVVAAGLCIAARFYHTHIQELPAAVPATAAAPAGPTAPTE